VLIAIALTLASGEAARGEAARDAVARSDATNGAAAQSKNKLRELKWENLKAKVEFEDPFEKLTQEQLMDLAVVARVRSLEKIADGKKVSEGMRKEATEAIAKLLKQDIDVEGLFARREEIKQLRTKRANAAVPELNGQTICMPGFVLPLEYDGKKVTEFLLVPWVGACIHTPPPPPNQIVHVAAKTPFETKGMFEAVSVTGLMNVKQMKKNLYLVDGSSDINLSYALAAESVVKYQKKP
jgi:hypothetical protein